MRDPPPAIATTVRRSLVRCVFRVEAANDRRDRKAIELNSEPQNGPLAIVGIGCLFPKAAGPGFYWANVKHGVDCIGEVPPTHWDPADYFDEDPKRSDMTYARR